MATANYPKQGKTKNTLLANLKSERENLPFFLTLKKIFDEFSSQIENKFPKKGKETTI